MPIRDNYVDPTSQKLTEEVDVITDLIEHHQMFAVACLPIARQIGSERTMTLKLPKNGDLFIGLRHHPNIHRVVIILNNYTEEIEIEGQLQTVNDLPMWRITELPIPLFIVDDYERIHITFQITLKSQSVRQLSTQNVGVDVNHSVFSVYYGYLHHKLKSQASTHHVLSLPLLGCRSFLKMVCGLWKLEEIV